MIGETLTVLLNSIAIFLQKGAPPEENILGAVLGALSGLLCGVGGLLCGSFVGQEIMTCLPEPFSKFIEPFLSCSLFESCPVLWRFNFKIRA